MKDRGQTWIKINDKDENETVYLEFNQRVNTQTKISKATIIH